VELAVSHAPVNAGVVALEQERGLVGARGQLAVEAVDGDVQLAVLVPADAEMRRVERDIPDARREAVPVDPLRDLRPEAVGIPQRLLVSRLVAGRADDRAGRELRRNRVRVAGQRSAALKVLQASIEAER
jgi:hypothetical protein